MDWGTANELNGGRSKMLRCRIRQLNGVRLPTANKLKPFTMLKNIGCSDVALASSLHEFKCSALAEAYQDSDLTPVSADGVKIHVPRLAPNKSGYYYLSKLPRPVRKQYRKNFKANVFHIPFKMWLESEALDTDDFISSGFTWNASREGYECWVQLNDQMRWAFDIQNNKNL